MIQQRMQQEILYKCTVGSVNIYAGGYSPQGDSGDTAGKVNINFNMFY